MASASTARTFQCDRSADSQDRRRRFSFCILRPWRWRLSGVLGGLVERIEPMRTIESSMTEVPEGDLDRGDVLEPAAVEQASQIPEVAALGPFQRRAPVRH
jgi:hypothetical protein